MSAGTPPPPTAPAPPVARVDPASTDDARYRPPGWLEKQRGNNRTNKLNPKVVILSTAAIFALLILTGVIFVALVATADDRFVEIPLDDLERPTFPDEDMFIDSMPDRSTPIVAGGELTFL